MARHRILVVDDQSSIRYALQLGLTRSGFVVEEAGDGEEALLLLKNTPVDLIIADIKMPKVDGLSFLKTLRANGSITPVILMTAHGSVETAVEAMKLGAQDFVMKPFSLDIIEAMVAKFLSQKDDVVRSTERPIITQNQKMQHIMRLIESVAMSRASVLIEGESGTGKELLARYVHTMSDRAKGPFVALNCAALPEQLLESELFGHEKGSFTGAIDRKIGKFELADGGTILLDEISEMNLQLQAKLLRVLQEYVVDRVGGKSPIPVNIRVVATTNRNLHAYVREGKFREDLYYRLNVIPVQVPPLRERKDDIALLAEYFVALFNAENRTRITGVGAEALSLLLANPWVGNIREFRNSMERAVLVAKSGELEATHFAMRSEIFARAVEQTGPTPQHDELFTIGTPMRDVERIVILKTLEKFSWNRTHAAETLGISIRTLRNKLREYRQDHFIPEWESA